VQLRDIKPRNTRNTRKTVHVVQITNYKLRITIKIEKTGQKQDGMKYKESLIGQTTSELVSILIPELLTSNKDSYYEL
jgi:hypothetical protein